MQLTPQVSTTNPASCQKYHLTNGLAMTEYKSFLVDSSWAEILSPSYQVRELSGIDSGMIPIFAGIGIGIKNIKIKWNRNLNRNQ